MKKYTINEINNELIINFFSKKTKSINIQLDHLIVKKEYKGLINCCDILIHLFKTRSKRMTYDLLYELAEFTNSKFSDNQIDWINTFIAINEIDYSRSLAKEESNEDGIDISDKIQIQLFFDRLKTINNEINKAEIRKAIRDSVIEKLKHRGIISKN